MMYPKFRSLWIAFAFCSLFFSCQQAREEAVPLQIPRPAANSITCDDGASMLFSYDGVDELSGNEQADLSFEVNTPPYSGDCLCGIEELHFIFGSLPANLEGVGVFDHEMNQVSAGAMEIDEVTYAPHSALVLTDPYSHFPTSELRGFIDFDDPNYVNSFEQSGGLCIIDNLDGLVDPTALRFAPITVTVPTGFIPGDSVTKVFIPNSMGN